jgi:uncharacterized protein YecT (DUF1311 family)
LTHDWQVLINHCKGRFMRRYLAFLAISLPLCTHAQEGASVIKACWDKGGSHVESVDCEYRKISELREEMRAAFEKRLKEAATSDAEMKAAGSKASIDIEKAVADSQDAFNHYMEEECGRRAAYMMGGTFGADIQMSCEIDLMQRRIAELNASY